MKQEPEVVQLEHCDDNFVVTASMLARWLGVTTPTIRAKCKNGRLPKTLPREKEKDQYSWLLKDLRPYLLKLKAQRRYKTILNDNKQK